MSTNKPVLLEVARAFVTGIVLTNRKTERREEGKKEGKRKGERRKLQA